MFKNVLLLLLLTSGLSFAGTTTFHKDHRANFVKMELIDQAQKSVDLEGEDLAKHFLENNATRFGLSASLIGLNLTKVQYSLLGSHYHYEQSLYGYKIQHAEIIISIAHDNGAVYMVYNNTYPLNSLKRPAAAGVNFDQAFDIAWQDLRVHGELNVAPSAQLVYQPEGSDFRLVYLVDYGVEAPFGYWRHTIDAQQGELLDVSRTTISRLLEDDIDFSSYKGQVYDRLETLSRFEARETARASQLNSHEKAAANGSADVFDPDPVTALQNSGLSDSSSASSFTAAYVNRTLSDIDLNAGTYRLNGPWVNISDFESPTSAPSTSSTGNWSNTRGNNAFNDTMTYFHIDQSQRYMQSLGFTSGTGIQYGSITADSDGASGADNSYFQPGSNRVSFGHGCVDDNEDAFVILHEYGHAIHHSINSNWSGGDTGGMGEGFGDYWGGSYRYRTSNGATFNPAWAFPWDGHNSCWGGRDMDQTAFQYDPGKSYPAHATVGGVYSDELWSTPLFQALVTLTGQSVAHSEVDQVILQAHFGLGSGLSMRDMATAIVNTAQSLYPAGNHASVFQAKFEAQNILDGTPPPTGTELINNQVVNNLSDAASLQKLYFINIPAGATNLSVTTSGGTGDADLYGKAGSAPTTGSYDCRSWASGNGESCSVASPASGNYYIMINAYTAYSGLTLSVSYDPPGGGCTGNNNQSGLSGSADSWQHFSISVPACATSLTVSMSGGTGDADLYTRFGAQPTDTLYDCRPYVGGNTESCPVSNPQTGTYYVSIFAYSTYSGVNLTISYQ